MRAPHTTPGTTSGYFPTKVPQRRGSMKISLPSGNRKMNRPATNMPAMRKSTTRTA